MVYVRRLIWDAWNVAHIARHRVTPDEVEQVCHGQHWTSATYAGRLRVVGPTVAGRMVTVVLAPRGQGVYYPVTARPASRKERRHYQQQKGGI
jgi:hypothetical protein